MKCRRGSEVKARDIPGDLASIRDKNYVVHRWC